jgi:hypothetical protein
MTFHSHNNHSAQSRLWSLFGKPARFQHDKRENLTAPKPDWVAFYPIWGGMTRSSDSERWGLPKDPRNSWAIMENFSYETLEHLACHNVESNISGIFRPRKGNMVTPFADYICFPWLIVEHKKEGGPAHIEKCYCQAANAGAAAVMMLETLAKIPGMEKHRTKTHIPPVVTMTTVDSIVRVWITYACGPSDDDNGAKYVSRASLPFVIPTCS